MRCSACSKENPVTNRFCIFCGTKVQHIDRDKPREPGIAVRLGARVDVLERELEHIRSVLTRQGVALPAFTDSAAHADDRLEGLSSSTSIPSRISERLDTPSSNRAFAPSNTSRVPKLWEQIAVDWEIVIGGNWLARVGVIAVVFGMAFFLKLAFDNDWIGETWRVFLGLFAGTSMLGAGEYLKHRYPIYANALLGGGIALLFLAVFAAHAIYGLVGFYTASGFWLLISITSAVLAIRHESIVLAIIGLFGAYISPFLLGGFSTLVDPSGNRVQGGQLIAYAICVNFGVLALSTFRNWRWLTLFGLGGSLITLTLWYLVLEGSEQLLIAYVGATIIFLQYVGGTTLFHFIWIRRPNQFDFALMTLNASAYFAISCATLWPEFRGWMGTFTLLLAAFYSVLAYISIKTRGRSDHLGLMLIGIAVIFVAIAVPVQLGGSWISVAWSVQGVILVWVAFVLKAKTMLYSGFGLLIVAGVRALIFDSVLPSEGYVIFLNYRTLGFLPVICALYAVAAIGNVRRSIFAGWDPTRYVYTAVIAANLLTLWVLSAEIIGALESVLISLPAAQLESITSLSLTLLWAIYAAAVLALGIKRKWRAVRVGGLLLLTVPIVKLFLIDSFALDNVYRVAAFLTLGAILLGGGFAYQRFSEEVRGFLFRD